ncbi:hypothetical protein PIB30_093363, partial [Stylosanthes scabra]|nr:hypothetical protein [Stylosanthes scabra]
MFSIPRQRFHLTDAPRPLSLPIRNSLVFKTDNIIVEESKPIERLTAGFVNKKGVTEKIEERKLANQETKLGSKNRARLHAYAFASNSDSYAGSSPSIKSSLEAESSAAMERLLDIS